MPVSIMKLRICCDCERVFSESPYINIQLIMKNIIQIARKKMHLTVNGWIV